MRGHSKVQKLFWAVAETKTSMCYHVLPWGGPSEENKWNQSQHKMQKHLCWCVTLRRFMAPLRSRRVSLNPLPVLSPPPANVAPLPPTWVDAPQHTNISRIVHCHSLYLKCYYEYWDWCAQLKEMSVQGFTNVKVFIFTWPFLSSNRALSTSFDVWMLCKIWF